MSKTLKVVIELNYDLDNHYQGESYETKEVEEIANDLEDNVYEDLYDLMRGDRLRFWSEVSVVEDNNE